MDVTLTLGKKGFVYLIIIYDCKDGRRHKRQREELTEHAGVHRRCQLTQMAVTLMVYTFLAVLLSYVC